jgi:hypothetical protein
VFPLKQNNLVVVVACGWPCAQMCPSVCWVGTKAGTIETEH